MKKKHHAILPYCPGGLMRCCIETLFTTPVREVKGEILQCKYCKDELHRMICDGKVWKWNHE